MTRRHTSFLLRCWDLGGDSERIEIEHVQSGTKGIVRSVGAAIEWICTYGHTELPHDREINQMSAAIGNERRGGGDNRFKVSTESTIASFGTQYQKESPECFSSPQGRLREYVSLSLCRS